MRSYLDFEKPVAELEAKVEEMRALQASGDAIAIGEEINRIEIKASQAIKELYASLTPWQKTQVARHPQRPHCFDYIGQLITDFVPLAGDRSYGDDAAIVCGLARLGGHKVMLIGHHKGRDTKEKVKCSFGLAHPEGYRKALRCMKLAEKFELPVVTLVDTPGAYPGIGAEERGQAYLIAVNLREMSRIATPVVCVVIGEGGSGGALGIGIGDYVAMLQFSYYSVISPEGCAGILWKDSKHRAEAAKALKFTSRNLLRFGRNLQLGTAGYGYRTRRSQS